MLHEPNGLADLKEVVQIAFWTVLGAISILTYRRAAKTILQPAKNEVFKFQISLLQDLYKFFSWRHEVQAFEDSGLEQCLYKNYYIMLDHYVETELKVSPKTKIIEDSDMVGAIMCEDFMRSSMVSSFSPNDTDDLVENKAEVLSWEKYLHQPIAIFRTYYEFSNSIKEYLDDPLLPKTVADRLRTIDTIAIESLEEVGALMDELAQELPKFYPTTDSLKTVETAWVLNRYNRRKPELMPAVSGLRDEIRRYLKSDELLSV